jgi:hypothetical protein
VIVIGSHLFERERRAVTAFAVTVDVKQDERKIVGEF